MKAMLDIKKISRLSELNELKQQYFNQSTAPLDGMWHFGFVSMSDHFGFYERDKLVGYCCINGDGYLLQYYLAPVAKTNSDELFNLMAEGKSSVSDKINGAFVSTAEPEYMSLSLDNSESFKVNALMYHQNEHPLSSSFPCIEMTLATQDQLTELVEFASEAIGAPKEWLTGYYGNLIQRQELWTYRKGGYVVAAGECRRFDEYQTGYADLGIIVAHNERGKGLATRILRFLIQYANSDGLTVICSTESANTGAKKAIAKAGLVSKNRIVQFDFK